jgi:tyrosyl-tRNA synthetase
MIQAGAVLIQKEKLQGLEITNYQLLKGKYLLVQRGKKNYFLLELI